MYTDLNYNNIHKLKVYWPPLRQRTEAQGILTSTTYTSSMYTDLHYVHKLKEYGPPQRTDTQGILTSATYPSSRYTDLHNVHKLKVYGPPQRTQTQDILTSTTCPSS
ncbi:hypothetical protein ACJMK2_036005, partial [Sinanodonta woodiana]